MIKKGIKTEFNFMYNVHEKLYKIMFMCALYIMPTWMLIPAINLLQVQTNRAYVKEIQVNQVSCASDLWSIKYLNSQDKSGQYYMSHKVTQ